MQPKLLKTNISEYAPAKWDGKDTSGTIPLGNRVLVLPDTAPEIIRNVHLPDDLVARHQMAAESGVVVALGDGAFIWNSDKVTPYVGRKPKPGDRVMIEKYAGAAVHGDDKNVYRIMDSDSIGAILEERKV